MVWFSGMANLILPRTLRACHGDEIWDKVGYNSACVKDICEIFASIGGFRGWAIECCQSNFTLTDARCNGTKFGIEWALDISWLTFVALATKFVECLPKIGLNSVNYEMSSDFSLTRLYRHMQRSNSLTAIIGLRLVKLALLKCFPGGLNG